MDEDRGIMPMNDVSDSRETRFSKSTAYRAVSIAVAVAVALVSLLVLSSHFSSPEAYSDTIASLDAKKSAVLALVTVSTTASVAVSAIPGDAATPLAEQLATLSSDFLLIITAILLEKYLLTTFGFLTFALLVPIACLLFAISILLYKNDTLRFTLMRLSAKAFLLGLALVLVVPSSVFVSNMIDQTYEESINATYAAAEQSNADTNTSADEREENSSDDFLEGLISTIQNTASKVADTVSGAVSAAQTAFNNLLEAFAVLLVTSCVIPILTLIFFLWLVKTILGVNVPVSPSVSRLRHTAHKKARAVAHTTRSALVNTDEAD